MCFSSVSHVVDFAQVSSAAPSTGFPFVHSYDLFLTLFVVARKAMTLRESVEQMELVGSHIAYCVQQVHHFGGAVA